MGAVQHRFNPLPLACVNSRSAASEQAAAQLADRDVALCPEVVSWRICRLWWSAPRAPLPLDRVLVAPRRHGRSWTGEIGRL